MTTLIGCRCKSGNIFSRALLIGRGLFLSVSRCESVLRLRRQMQAGRALRLWRRNLWFHRSKKVNRKFIDDIISYATFRVRETWPKLIKVEVSEQISRWPSMRKPPVPIPNTVVKTYRGENTWRATAWKDSSLPTSNLRKKENWLDNQFSFF